MEEVQRKCDNCEEREASFSCSKCKEWYCSWCDATLHKSPAIRNHGATAAVLLLLVLELLEQLHVAMEHFCQHVDSLHNSPLAAHQPPSAALQRGPMVQPFSQPVQRGVR